MIADFHNDCLTKSNVKELVKRYSRGKNFVNCAFFKGKRDFLTAFNACKTFEQYFSSGKIFLSFEDFSFESEREKEILLSFKPVCVSLTWNYDNFLAGGAKSQGGLKTAGKSLVKRLNELKIPVDCAHLNEKSFFEVVEFADKVVCTHTAFCGVRKHFRNLSDEQIKTIIDKGGIIGLAFYSDFLSDGNATERNLIEHIDYFVSKFGYDNLCLGTDFNGCDDFPECYADYRCERRLKNSLLALGYDIVSIEKILCGNLLNFLTKSKSAQN